MNFLSGGDRSCEFVGVGLNHTVVSKRDGFVRKIPTPVNKLTLEQARASADFYSSYFPEFVPKTRIVEGEGGEYIVIQKKIEGKILSQISPSDLSKETLHSLLAFVSRVQNMLRIEGVKTDVVGKREIDDRHFINFMKCLPFPWRDLYVFYHLRNFFQSSNIIINDNGEPFFIDTVGNLADKEGNIERRGYIDIKYWDLLYQLYRNSIESILEKRD